MIIIGVVPNTALMVFLAVRPDQSIAGYWWIVFPCAGLMILGASIADVHAVRLMQSRRDQELAAGRFLNCIVCHYDLQGTRGSRCPECGASVRIDDWRCNPDAAAKPLDDEKQAKARQK